MFCPCFEAIGDIAGKSGYGCLPFSPLLFMFFRGIHFSSHSTSGPSPFLFSGGQPVFYPFGLPSFQSVVKECASLIERSFRFLAIHQLCASPLYWSIHIPLFNLQSGKIPSWYQGTASSASLQVISNGVVILSVAKQKEEFWRQCPGSCSAFFRIETAC